MDELPRAVVELASPIGLTASSRETVVHSWVKNYDTPPGNGPHEYWEDIGFDV